MELVVPPVFRDGQDPCVANALRRAALRDVGCVAPGDVLVRRNDSVMTDEQLAHRIGQLLVDNDRASAGDVLHLQVVAAEGQRPVMSSELEPAAAVVGPPVVLVVLGPGQRVDLDVTLRRSCGGEHQRFCPIEVAAYRPSPHGAGFSLVLHPTGASTASRVARDAVDAFAGSMRRCCASVKSAGPSAPRH